MSYIEVIIESIILLLCPLGLYLLYTIYKKNLSCDEKDLGFEVAIISSLYFVLRFGTCCYNDYPIILFDIPLLICYYKRKISLGIFITLILIVYETLFLGINPLFLALEYSSYLIVYSLFVKRKLKPINVVNYFIVIKSFMLSLAVFWFISPEKTYSSNLFYIFTIIITLYFVTNIIISIFAKGEKVVELHNDLENIEKEKDLRRSLFKVTHEIKNPIAVCKGYLDMIDINDKKKVRKYIPIIKDEITRTLVLMDDFLDYTKIKIEKEDIKEKVLDYLYEIRYLKYLPIDKSKVLKDIISFEDIEKVMINKGLNLNLITPISNNKDTDYLLLKSIFNTKNINLEDLCIKLVVKDGKLESQIYDGDILDSTNYINLQKGSSVQIRKTKKVKIFN